MAKPKGKSKGPSDAGQATKVYNQSRSARGGPCKMADKKMEQQMSKGDKR